MLEAKFTEAGLFKRIIDSFRDCVQLINFNCSEKGIAAQAVDDSRVLLVSLSINVEAFEEFRADRNVVLGCDLTNLSKILRCGNNSDNLTLIAEDSPDSILILFEDTKRDRVSEYSLKLMEIETDFLEISDMKYESYITMPSADFAKTVRDLSQLSDSINILVTKDTIKFAAEGDIGSGSIVVKPFTDLDHPESSIKVTIEKPVDLRFGAKYLNDIIKGSSLSDTITIKLSEEAPALFQFDISSGNLQFYLAPKFDEEE
ncbi:Pol30 [Kluyveromyces lactis]|uniref:DNA sliding clamp PCNA n=1 Tax=Kluyveromyces lactis (strain ATCC 8585 / CBS 2359 / DSM 70799 / NBRC 1267 / NRRL Y-1140 / WM37) TaxID=284590 RepID=PCNA_KLULA|nr:uncharacterized protein KLLA0_B12078g [Kluyveromyces lactis]QEU61722.1 Pol30 [Kluyveromyces lactis]CAH02460.1 KLLA0B12078p [Kluyveromyces lactis]|eukprot:XP_452067.1 uncharacterized protein KLLA0_B12078g [Kluyveromyces lactis]